MNERLLTEDEFGKCYESSACHEVDGVMVIDELFNFMKVLKAQDAKSIAEHNKWIAEQKEAIMEQIMDNFSPYNPVDSGYNVADAIISLLVGEAKS